MMLDLTLVLLLGHVLVVVNHLGISAEPIDVSLLEDFQRFHEPADISSDASPLSLVTDYVGIAYNLLYGNPDGDFDDGGLDPGLRLARKVFKLTYDNGEEVYYKDELVAIPDQVEFQQVDTCSSSETTSVYSGTESYQEKLDVNVAVKGKYKSLLSTFRFSLSTSYSRAESKTSKVSQVVLEKMIICNVGRARYLLDTAFNNHYSVSDDFYYAVKNLPSLYIENDYMEFIENWGTHIIMEMDLGGKEVERYQSDYSELYEYARTEVGASVSASASYQGYSGSFKVDVDTFNEEVSSEAEFGSQFDVVRSGSTIEEVSEGHYQVPSDDERPPIPIMVTLDEITTALDERLWTVLPEQDETYDSLGIAEKLANLDQALVNYPTWASAPHSSDPEVIIPNAWPDGTYSLPMPDSGCPSGGNQFTWHSGKRYHDTNGKNNEISDPNDLAGAFGKNIEVEYCTKTDAGGDYGISWPAGAYCIGKKGRDCPSGFDEGELMWDDKNKKNDNTHSGTLPEGVYDSNTLIYFCCRDDGFASNEINLPTEEPFYLWLYDRADGCQEVAGMEVREDFVKWKTQSKNKASGAYPVTSQVGGKKHLFVHYCYYK